MDSYSNDDEMQQKNDIVIKPILLNFSLFDMEQKYLVEVAQKRWSILLIILGCDVVVNTLKIVWEIIHGTLGYQSEKLGMLLSQAIGCAVLHTFFQGLSWHVRNTKYASISAGGQEVVLTGLCVAAMLQSFLKLEGDGSYTYLAYYLICTSTFLKLRWWLGSLILSIPAGIAYATMEGNDEAQLHIVVAFIVGNFMAYTTEKYRRQAFISQCNAAIAHQKELLQAKAKARAQQELAEAQVQVNQRSLVLARERASNEAKSEFMSLMCHEVRTPLNGCLASGEMLLETWLTEEQRELANTIHVSGSILLSTVSNFLDFFKIEAGKQLEVVQVETNVREMVREVHGIMGAMLNNDDKDVVLIPPDIADNVPHAILEDRDRLRGIILNLYSNAVKFTQKGHVVIHVQVVSNATLQGSSQNDTVAQRSSSESLESGGSSSDTVSSLKFDPDKWFPPHSGLDWFCVEYNYKNMESLQYPRVQSNQWLLVEVEDTGEGITEEAIRSIFRSYVQVASDKIQQPRKYGGTGLGLSICSNQVKLLNGRIGACSKRGKGSIFWFLVPLVPCKSHISSKPPIVKRDKYQQQLSGRRRASWTCSDVFTDSHNSYKFLTNNRRFRRGFSRPIEDDFAKEKARREAIHQQQMDWSYLAPVLTNQQKLVEVQGESSSSEVKQQLDLSMLKGIRILLVEDNLINQKVACRILATFETQFEVVSDGLEAIEKLQQGNGQNFDLVLMDMAMPKMDGVEATQRIRNLGYKLPIVAMTANTSEKHKQLCLDVGMDSFLSKPVLKKKLADAILVALSNKQAANE